MPRMVLFLVLLVPFVGCQKETFVTEDAPPPPVKLATEPAKRPPVEPELVPRAGKPVVPTADPLPDSALDEDDDGVSYVPPYLPKGLAPVEPEPSPRLSRSQLRDKVMAQRSKAAQARKRSDYRKPEAPRFKPGEDLHDQSVPEYALLQKPEQALRHFPLDSYGGVDWVKALLDGHISPRKAVSGEAVMLGRENDIIMKNTRDMPWVRFPHSVHTEWLDCTNCHPVPFKASEGVHEILMEDIFAGRFCGVCHDKVAFSVMSCERCHSVLQPGQKRWW